MHDWFAYKDVVPRHAAAAILWSRGEDDALELLLARRNKNLPFMGGHHVFPGGRLNAEEAPVQGAADEAAARSIGAAAREVFEETGLLCAEHDYDVAHLRTLRERMLAGELHFADVLDAVDAQLHAKDFLPAGTWVTPPFSPIRYQTNYYLYEVRGERYELIEHDDAEIVGLEWMTPREARQRWHLGQMRLSTPVAFVLQHLAQLPFDSVLPWLVRTPGLDITTPNRFELRRGLHLIPVRSPTLPPATHTNCIVIGEERLLVVDPGAHEESEQAHLLDHLAHLTALGGQVEAVVLTHGHPDHTGAAARIAELHGAPIWAHAHTARQTGLPVQRELHDTEVLHLPGEPGWEVVCLHTPGHDPGHLALLERSTRTLLAGDLVANPGTIIISPDYEGDMTQYLDSLARVINEDFNFMIPSHGMPFWMQDAKQVLRDLVTHRLNREERIKQAIAAGATNRTALLAAAYDDVAEAALPLADHQLRAHLARLGHALER